MLDTWFRFIFKVVIILQHPYIVVLSLCMVSFLNNIYFTLSQWYHTNKVGWSLSVDPLTQSPTANTALQGQAHRNWFFVTIYIMCFWSKVLARPVNWISCCFKYYNSQLIHIFRCCFRKGNYSTHHLAISSFTSQPLQERVANCRDE